MKRLALYKAFDDWELSKADSEALIALDSTSFLLGIHKTLYQMLGKQGFGWVNRPNSAPLFDGHETALDFMLENKFNIAATYNYLRTQA